MGGGDSPGWQLFQMPCTWCGWNSICLQWKVAASPPLRCPEGQFTQGLLEAQGRFQVGSAAEAPLEPVGLNSCAQTQGQECNVFLLRFFFLPASLIFKSLWFTLEFCNPNFVSLCYLRNNCLGFFASFLTCKAAALYAVCNCFNTRTMCHLQG